MRPSVCVILSAVVLASAMVTVVAGCPVSGVNAQVWKQGQQFGSIHGEYNYYLSPCAMGFPNSQASCGATQPATGFFGQWDLQGTNNAGCQFMMDTQKKNWTAFNSGAGSGYHAEFTAASGSTASIGIVCNESASNLEPLSATSDVEVSSIGIAQYSYQVTLKSNAVCAPPTPPPTNASGSGGTDAPTLVNCTVDGVKHVNVPVADCYPAPPPKKEEGGCGGGCAFLIGLFVGGFVYVVATVIFNFVKGKRGKELAPHPEFWGEVPGLIKDGAIFFAAGVCALVDKCRGKGGSSNGGGGYSSV